MTLPKSIAYALIGTLCLAPLARADDAPPGDGPSDWLLLARREIDAVPAGTEGFDRVKALSAVAKIQAKLGDKTAAATTAKDCEASPQRGDDETEDQKAVIDAFIAAGDIEHVEAMAGRTGESYFWLLATEARARAGQYDKANADKSKIKDDFYKRSAAMDIAAALAEAGRVDDAKTAAGGEPGTPNAFSLARGGHDPDAMKSVDEQPAFFRPFDLVEVFNGQLARGDRPAAGKTLDLLLSEYKSAPADQRWTLQLAIAPALMKIGRQRDAVELLTPGIEQAKAHPTGKDKPPAAADLARLLAECDDLTDARRLLEKVPAERPPSPAELKLQATTRPFMARPVSSRDQVLAAIAARLAFDKQDDDAIKALADCEWPADRESPETMALIAADFARAGDPAGCRKLLAAATTPQQRAWIAIGTAAGMTGAKQGYAIFFLDT